MIEIIIFLFILCLIIGILKAIWDAFKDIILGILGIAVIIAAVAFLGPIVLGVIPVVLGALPMILAILAGLFILGCIISLWEKLKYGSQMRELDQVGIQKISNSMNHWEKPESLGLVVVTKSGYVISNQFRKRVAQNTDRKKVVAVNTFQDCCLQAAPSFQPNCTIPFLEYMVSQDLLVPLRNYTEDKQYLSRGTVQNCEHLLEAEGAATEDEFSTICKSAPACSGIPVKSEIIAATILNYMLKKGAVHKVELSDLNEALFVSNTVKSSSKMVRREISMD